MELEVPKRPIFKPTFIYCHGSTSFVMRVAKEIPLLQKSRDHGIICDFIFYFIYTCVCACATLNNIVVKTRKKKKGRKVNHGK